MSPGLKDYICSLQLVSVINARLENKNEITMFSLLSPEILFT